MSKLNTKTARRSFCAAFTLAELLTAVLVISIIMVALAPVITKRMQQTVDVQMTKKKGEEVFSNPGDYVFEIPIGINTLYIQAAGGSGGGSGVSWFEHTANYNKAHITSCTYNWTVPKGVSEIELTITGSGGGGGAGYIKDAADVYNSPSISSKPILENGKRLKKTDVTVYNNKCLSDEFLATRGADDEYDLCITKENISFTDWLKYMWDTVDTENPKPMYRNSSASEAEYCTTTYGNCFWPKGSTVDGGNGLVTCSNDTGYSECNRPLTTLRNADTLCKVYHTSEEGYYHDDYADSGSSAGYRLLTTTEAEKLGKYGKTWGGKNGLRLCGPWTYGFESCTNFGTCPGSPFNNCRTDYVAIEGGTFLPHFQPNGNDYAYAITQRSPYSFIEAISVRCARPLYRSTNYNGGGGSSGAQLTRTLKVLPGDVLTFTIGAGGAGGKLGTNNGNGSQGAQTKVVHKRGSTTMGTYYVNGATGGKGATSYAHGSASTVSTSSVCYAQYRNTPAGSLTGGTTSCGKNSQKGDKGTAEAGGDGAVSPMDSKYKARGGVNFVDDSRSANTRSTTKENTCTKGENASPYSSSSSSYYCENRENSFADADDIMAFGGGGGGGFVPNWGAGYSTTQRKSYFSGGQGGSGNISLKYKVQIPGAGGGAGAQIAGLSTTKDDSGAYQSYEILYKVKEGEKLSLTVGSGGQGGEENQDGTDGSATSIKGTNGTMVFFGGEGAKAVSYEDKQNFKECLDSRSNGSGGSTTPSTLINTTCYEAPSAGRASVIDADGDISTNSLGLLLPSSSSYVYSVSRPTSTTYKAFKGNDGKVSPQGTKTSQTPWSYRLDGGMGGTTFSGTYTSQTASGVACGGGISASYGPTVSINSLYNYTIYCLNGTPDGTSGKKYQQEEQIPLSGGAGGGVIEGADPGKGGSGSGGYIRIRWDEAKNRDW